MPDQGWREVPSVLQCLYRVVKKEFAKFSNQRLSADCIVSRIQVIACTRLGNAPGERELKQEICCGCKYLGMPMDDCVSIYFLEQWKKKTIGLCCQKKKKKKLSNSIIIIITILG